MFFTTEHSLTAYDFILNVKIWDYTVSINEGENPETHRRLKSIVGEINGQIIIASYMDWLIGLDIQTGKELWVLKGIPEVWPHKQGKIPDQFHNIYTIKLDSEKGVIYGFHYNIYWEWGVKDRKLVTLVDKSEEAKAGFWEFDGGNYVIIDDIIYYPNRGSFSRDYGREAWPKLMAVNKHTGEIVDQLEFKKKKGEKAIAGWKDFQYADGKFYLLDSYNTLRVIEK